MPEVVIEVDQVSLAKAFLAVQAAAAKKADNMRILDLREQSAFTEYFLVCSATSDRQAMAIADSIGIELKEDGFNPVAVEGYRDGRWIIMDYGDLVVHVFLDALRDYYNLEGLWGQAPRVPIPQELYISPPMN